MVSLLVAGGPNGCSTNVENRLNAQQYWSAKIISNYCHTVKRADIELIIVGCCFSLLVINGRMARGCGIK